MFRTRLERLAPLGTAETQIRAETGQLNWSSVRRPNGNSDLPAPSLLSSVFDDRGHADRQGTAAASGRAGAAEASEIDAGIQKSEFKMAGAAGQPSMRRKRVGF
jgi:hypothetical protein